MGWWRSLLAEVFPSWHERRLLREMQAESDKNLDALQKLRRKIAMEDKAESQKPARDVREQPAPNPNGYKGPKTPLPEVPPAGDHVPTKAPERAKKDVADRGAV
jgi:hypothetical protein